MRFCFMIKKLVLLPFFIYSFCIAQNHFTISAEFGPKIDNYYYINELGQTFKQNYGNPTFGFNFAYNANQHIIETGFHAYLFHNPAMNYDFVNNKPINSFGGGGSGLSDYWVPIKYGYEFPINKKQNIFLQPCLAFNIFVGEYTPPKNSGSWGYSSSNPSSNEPYSINIGEEYINGRTNFGIEPSLVLTYRIARRFDIYCNFSYQLGFKPRYYDLITHTN